MKKPKNKRRQHRDRGVPSIVSGAFRGLPFTRIPIWYLQQLVSENGPYRAIAAAEIERRGTRHPSRVEVSAHAIDRASLQAIDLFHASSDENEGIYTWLGRMAENALEYGAWADERMVDYAYLRFCFDLTKPKAVLTSVMRTRPLAGQRMKKLRRTDSEE